MLCVDSRAQLWTEQWKMQARSHRLIEWSRICCSSYVKVIIVGSGMGQWLINTLVRWGRNTLCRVSSASSAGQSSRNGSFSRYGLVRISWPELPILKVHTTYSKTDPLPPALPPRLYCRTPAWGRTYEASNCPEPTTGDVLLELLGNCQHQPPDNDDAPTLLSSGIACFLFHKSAHHVGWRFHSSFWQQPGTEHKSSVPCCHSRLDCWSRRRQPSVLCHP